MSTVIINDGFELVSQSEVNDGSTLFLNYRLTRDMPIGEYSNAVEKIRKSFENSAYRNVHINVERGGHTPMEPTISEQQSVGRSNRDTTDKQPFYIDLDVYWNGYIIERECVYTNEQNHIDRIGLEQYLFGIDHFSGYRVLYIDDLNTTIVLQRKAGVDPSYERVTRFLEEFVVAVNSYGYDRVHAKLVK